jgi:hypothetical protein
MGALVYNRRTPDIKFLIVLHAVSGKQRTCSKASQRMKLYIGGLPPDMDDEELLYIFEDYGKVRSAKVILDKETRQGRGSGSWRWRRGRRGRMPSISSGGSTAGSWKAESSA